MEHIHIDSLHDYLHKILTDIMTNPLPLSLQKDYSEALEFYSQSPNIKNWNPIDFNFGSLEFLENKIVVQQNGQQTNQDNASLTVSVENPVLTTNRPLSEFQKTKIIDFYITEDLFMLFFKPMDYYNKDIPYIVLNGKIDYTHELDFENKSQIQSSSNLPKPK
jgi:hypothetical protein